MNRPSILNADSEQEQLQMDELLDRIRPCLDSLMPLSKRPVQGQKDECFNFS